MDRDYLAMLEAYQDRFDEAFPTYLAPDNENDQMDIIEACLKTNKPYNPEIDPNVVY